MTEPQPKIEQPQPNQELPPGYCSSLEVENVFCFKTRQTLDLCGSNGFPAQWTVILGDNGVGKTTLLRYLAGMQPCFFNFGSGKNQLPRLAIKVYSSAPWPEIPGLRHAQANIKANFVYGSRLSSWKDFSRDREKKSPTVKKASLESINGEIPNSRSYPFSLQCYGYGSTRRMGKTSLSDTLSSDPASTLFSDDAELINAEEWLLQADYAAARSDSKTNRFEQRLTLIKETLEKILPDIDDIRIAPANETRSRPIAEFLTPYGWVSLSSLGLGYRTVIAWIVDLAARMVERYPSSPDPLAEPAVVLVDEIDLHLHPKWQRIIMSFLTERFPNTQFIVTAHSPLVVQSARNANLVLLRREEDRVIIDNHPEVIDNWRVEQILTSVFELPTSHPVDIEPFIQRRREILAKPSLTKKDEKELKELEVKIGVLPSAETIEDIRAMDIIRKAAKLLENK
jgi:energy-coupling factor transporter ATP-binding protein EcfA2